MDTLKKYFKKFHFKKRGHLISFGASPEADWRIVFFSGCLLAAFVILGSVYIFIKVGRGEIFTVQKPTASADKSLDTTLLGETVQYYKDKAAEFEKIKSSKPDAVDPSL